MTDETSEGTKSIKDEISDPEKSSLKLQERQEDHNVTKSFIYNVACAV